MLLLDLAQFKSHSLNNVVTYTGECISAVQDNVLLTDSPHLASSEPQKHSQVSILFFIRGGLLLLEQRQYVVFCFSGSLNVGPSVLSS